jgi:hypothetical protein
MPSLRGFRLGPRDPAGRKLFELRPTSPLQDYQSRPQFDRLGTPARGGVARLVADNAGQFDFAWSRVIGDPQLALQSYFSTENTAVFGVSLRLRAQPLALHADFRR